VPFFPLLIQNEKNSEEVWRASITEALARAYQKHAKGDKGFSFCWELFFAMRLSDELVRQEEESDLMKGMTRREEVLREGNEARHVPWLQRWGVRNAVKHP